MKLEDISTKSIRSLLPARPECSHKGTFGRVLCVAGSYCMSGAAYLCAKAAYRMGAGLVRILTPGENRVILQSSLPEALLTVYDRFDPDVERISEAVEWADVIAIGPGMGKNDAARTVLVTVLERARCPLVIDADALNLIARDEGLWRYVPRGSVLTPHHMEMFRLSGLTLDEITSDIPSACMELAVQRGVVCVLKDHNTAVSDGKEIYVNHTGNSGMATGGSGDVLTGIIAALRAFGIEPLQAASLGVRIHGEAGDAAAKVLGEYSMMASDIIEYLPHVLK